MRYWKLITRSLIFFWRTHLAVFFGTAVCTAVLVGALVVGDSDVSDIRPASALGATTYKVSDPGDLYRLPAWLGLE